MWLENSLQSCNVLRLKVTSFTNDYWGVYVRFYILRHVSGIIEPLRYKTM